MKQLGNLENPRKNAIEAMKASVPQVVWDKNLSFIASIKQEIHSHAVSRHEAIGKLNNGKFDKEQMKVIHLEYRHAIVQIFTDALLMAQHLSAQLEPRLKPASKMPARFLLTLNVHLVFGLVRTPKDITRGAHPTHITSSSKGCWTSLESR